MLQLASQFARLPTGLCDTRKIFSVASFFKRTSWQKPRLLLLSSRVRPQTLQPQSQLLYHYDYYCTTTIHNAHNPNLASTPTSRYSLCVYLRHVETNGEEGNGTTPRRGKNRREGGSAGGDEGFILLGVVTGNESSQT